MDTSEKSKIRIWLALQDLIRNPEKHAPTLEAFNADLAKTILNPYEPQITKTMVAA